MKENISSPTKVLILAIVTVIIVILILNAEWFGNLLVREEDRSDYAVVATNFINKNGFIANKLGKVTDLSHVGDGGAGGGVSYNVFRVSGTDNKGICYVNLAQDSEDQWYITSSDIFFDGKTLSVPVKRSQGIKWKKFKLK